MSKDKSVYNPPPNVSCNLTNEQLAQACKNIGFDITCGACAMLFYTGYTGPTARHDAMPSDHDSHCETTYGTR